mmetsp:Transcript_18933/g.33781  ORF Transcript_18933/g.33781 Transcript_18933/m.33781 type:complete len:259 (-) Transcript_18933:1033-1809(-)
MHTAVVAIRSPREGLHAVIHAHSHPQIVAWLCHAWVPIPFVPPSTLHVALALHATPVGWVEAHLLLLHHVVLLLHEHLLLHHHLLLLLILLLAKQLRRIRRIQRRICYHLPTQHGMVRGDLVPDRSSPLVDSLSSNYPLDIHSIFSALLLTSCSCSRAVGPRLRWRFLGMSATFNVSAPKLGVVPRILSTRRLVAVVKLDVCHTGSHIVATLVHLGQELHTTTGKAEALEEVSDFVHACRVWQTPKLKGGPIHLAGRA